VIVKLKVSGKNNHTIYLMACVKIPHVITLIDGLGRHIHAKIHIFAN